MAGMELVWPWRSHLAWPPRWSELLDEDSFIRVEEVVKDGELVIKAELPGVDPDKDVELVVDKGVLTLHAERREESKEEKGERRRSEFRYGSYSRSVALPAGATEDDVKATYENGILEIRIPVNKDKAVARKVPITKT